MLVVVSPAKALNFEPAPAGTPHSQPALMTQTRQLLRTVRALSSSDLAGLMSLSEKLAGLNHDRYRAFRVAHRPDNAKQAVLAFAGDTYRGLDAASFTPDDLAWAQDHLRILSGLYGLLRPLDLIQPYRLEMGTRLATPRGRDLYEFWGDRIARALDRALREHASPVLVNAASAEYFGAVRNGRLAARVIRPEFREERGGTTRVLGYAAKRARGMIARFAVRNRIERPEDLREFRDEGYRFRADLSDGDDWVFVRSM